MKDTKQAKAIFLAGWTAPSPKGYSKTEKDVEMVSKMIKALENIFNQKEETHSSNQGKKDYYRVHE